MTEKVGITLTKEIIIEVNWTGIAEKLFNVAVKGFAAYMGDVKSGVEAGFTLVGAAKEIEENVPEETRAFELIILCFAKSFDSIRASDYIDPNGAKKAAKDAIEWLKKEVEKNTLTIPYDFFDTPTSAKPYELLRDKYLENRKYYRLSLREKEEDLKYRFDSAFRAAVWELWSSNTKAFVDLANKLNSPTAKSADFERQWISYRQSLINDFNVSPVFGQSNTGVSLSQLYVPLRCTWTEQLEEEIAAESTSFGGSGILVERNTHLSLLSDEIEKWVDNTNPDDWLRLIGGGPGSGKSTSLRAIAAKVAQREDLRPLFIPLQRINLKYELREAINRYFINTSGSPFETAPLERKNIETGPRILLILDGLDEIARPGENADQIARDLIEWIQELYREIKGTTDLLHKIIISGRMPSFQAARNRYGKLNETALEVLGFVPSDTYPKFFGTNVIIHRKDIHETDDREAWWKLYSAAFNKDNEIPIGLKDQRLEELTNEPLLCYLLALSGYLEENTEQVADNRNYIYEKIMDNVWKRPWGGGRAGTGKLIENKEEFYKLFETMALAAWHEGEERIVKYDSFQNALSLMQTEQIYEKFQKAKGNTNLANLAVNFYLQNSEIDSKGFEFTHKSFGEYLSAKALLKLIFDISKMSEYKMEFALKHWLDIVENGSPTKELNMFIRDEIRIISASKIESIAIPLQNILIAILRDGLPAHDIKHNISWRNRELRQNSAEILLITIVSSVFERLATDTTIKKQYNLRIPAHLFVNLLYRTESNEQSYDLLINSLSHINSEGAIVNWKDFQGSNLENAILEDIKAIGADFTSSNLKKAKLKDANFVGATLTYANLDGANLINADFSKIMKSLLRRTRYKLLPIGKSLDRKKIRTDLRYISAINANFKDANFEEADLEGANLEGANLEDANFEDANLKEVNFEAANLKGANLWNANFEGTNFVGANLEGTNLREENFES